MRSGCIFSCMSLLALISLSACKKEPADRDAPQVSAFTLPADSSTITGNQLQIEARVTDNEQLSQYKLIIQPVSNAFLSFDSLALSYWQYTRIQDVSGADALISDIITLPDTCASAWYAVILSAVDASGNVSPADTHVVFIRNPMDGIVPAIQLQWPADLQVFTNADTLGITATVSDNAALSSVEFNLYQNSVLLQTAQNYPTGTSANVALRFPLSGFAAGSYRFELTVYDRALNSATESRNFGIQ